MYMWLTTLEEVRLENRRSIVPWVVAGAKAITIMTTSTATNRILLQAA
jgi:hypothetical protein